MSKKIKENTTTAAIAPVEGPAVKVKRQQDSLVKDQKDELKEDTAKLVNAVKSLYDLYSSKFSNKSRQEILRKVAQHLEIPTSVASQYAPAVTEDEGYDFAADEKEYEAKQNYEAAIEEEIRVLYDTLKDEEDQSNIAGDIAEIIGISIDKVEKVIAEIKGEQVIGEAKETEEDEKDEDKAEEDKEEDKDDQETGEDSKDDEKENSEDDEIDGYVFGYKGDVLVVKGLEHPAAETLAASILAQFRKTFQLAIDQADLHNLVITIEKKKEEETEE